MFIRTPAHGPLANSNARLAVVLRSERGHRIIEIGGRAVIALLLLSALMLAWFLVASFYLVMRDDVVVSVLGGQGRTHFAYEDRILELRQRIDRITARQLVNQDTIEDRVAGLVARQAELEARQMMVADVASRADKAGLAPPPIPAEDPAPLPSIFTEPRQRAKPRPLPAEASAFAPAPSLAAPRGFEAPKNRGPMEGVVGEVERRAERMERLQIDLLHAIGASGETEIARSRRAVAAIGLDPGRFGKNAFTLAAPKRPAPLGGLQLRDVATEPPANTGIGGPFVPVTGARPGSEQFEQAMRRAESAMESAKGARAILEALPLGRPLTDRHELSSGFGTRLDPFTRGLALHSGLDFKAAMGTPVHAVAAGRVVEAGPSGGYGRMVEIDHGNGISTRYAHLSAINVEEGARIDKGAVLGHVGSTGRSTGPHLHYEVRIDEDATDPMRFVRAERLNAGE